MIRPLLALALLLPASAAPAADPGPAAAAVADRVLAALGGQEAWRNTRFLRFDFAVEVDGKPLMSRAHTWDKWNGRYRLEARNKEGQPYLVLMNLNTKEGQAWLDGKPQEGEAKQKLLEKAYAVWINDTYWLLMPFKMKDPGVLLTAAGQDAAGGESWDKVLLSFENVGLTPKDKYWVWVNKKTGLVDRWDYILAGGKGPATRFDWKDWRKVGKVMLAADRVNAAEKERIHFPVLDAPATLPDSVFTTP